ncbi:ankyrin repeat domain-containing protein 13B-like [Tropilaelaps mercedesae]|uniref:Ankyrin repeat domain-containing protein 13B-like n=1 Tax=Tropilaelaps mercedesae TaxID=418985 RepID=A0A1V9WYY9_9ACAR|nr:ankyrin repeat domain-containing protein 13B-like [Tropilaelaps mercedesae]
MHRWTMSDLEVRDPRGRTPLMLAVTLGHVRCVRILLEFGATANVENREGYTATHEAVSTGDPELLALVLHARDLQKYQSSVAAIPDLLKNIRDTPDFYVEMKWEFTSWVPLLSRVCPSDTYRVYKSGSNVRIDTTLLGFEHSSWQRGKRSYIFKGEGKLDRKHYRGEKEGKRPRPEIQRNYCRSLECFCFDIVVTFCLNDAHVTVLARAATQATLYEVNHDAGQVHAEVMHVSAPGDHTQVVNSLRPDPENIAARLCSPVVCTYVDTDKIHFDRVRTGMLGWRTDRTENVNGFEAKDLVESRGNPCHIRPEEYFDETVPLVNRDIGRPRESASRVQRFKATLWLCDTYPLSLAEQVLPIVDLMSLNSSHFAKLRSFITLQLPTGFPVKIEIPLFHVLNARVTFGNINGNDCRVPGVERDQEQGKCTIDPSIFEIPRGYTRIGERRLLFFPHTTSLMILRGSPAAVRRRTPQSPQSPRRPLEERRRSRDASRGDRTQDKLRKYSVLNPTRSHPFVMCRRVDMAQANTSGPNRSGAVGGNARGGRASFYAEEEDELLQFAIEQSLVDADSLEDKVTVWEALNSAAPRYETNGNISPNKDEAAMLLLPPSNGNGPPNPAVASPNLQDATRPLSKTQCPTHPDHHHQHLRERTQTNGHDPMSNGIVPTPTANGSIKTHQQPLKHHSNGQDELLYRALQNGVETSTRREAEDEENDDELCLALKLSRELREEEERKIAEEEELMARILQLSLTDQ